MPRPGEVLSDTFEQGCKYQPFRRIDPDQHIFKQGCDDGAQPFDNAPAFFGQMQDTRAPIRRIAAPFQPARLFQPVNNPGEGDRFDLQPLGMERLILARMAFQRQQQPRLRGSKTKAAHPFIEQAAQQARIVSEAVAGFKTHACRYNKHPHHKQGQWLPAAIPGSSAAMTHTTATFASFDGTPLAIHTEGEGRPVILLHGLFSSAQMNWIKWGHSARLAAAGFRAIMLDFRVHGDSGAPREPGAYPRGVLMRDVAALIDHLGLAEGEYDLAGFSLGARTAVHGCASGVFAPRRLVLAGMGVSGLADWQRRAGFFTRVIDEFDTIERGDPAYLSRQFLKSQGVDRVAARLLLGAFDDLDLGSLANVTVPTLVICGDRDQDNGSARDLAALLPDATYEEVPGGHLDSATKPELGEGIVRYLLA